MNRPRNARNKGLPPNLYPHGKSAYRYKHPQTGTFHGMGSDRPAAIQAAKKLNALLIQSNDLVQQVLTNKTTVADYADRWYNQILPERELSEGTMRAYLSSVRAIKTTWGKYQLHELSTKLIAEGLEGMTRSGAIAVRGRLADMLKEAAADGLVNDNQAELTRKRKAKTARKRMTLEQFQAIRAEAPPWLQNAMDLALVTLQRASDILEMRFDQLRDGCLYVIQQKTQKHDTGYLKIGIDGLQLAGVELRALLSRCRDNTPSPYIVHRIPKHKRKGKQGHWTKVEYSQIQKDFAAAREACGLFKDWGKGTAPTFHEIRALGIKLFKDQGIDPQRLAGHASEQMTANYDSRHEDIRWVEFQL